MHAISMESKHAHTHHSLRDTSRSQGLPFQYSVHKNAWFSEMFLYLYLSNIIPDTNTRLVPINTNVIPNIGTLWKQFCFISYFLWYSEQRRNPEGALILIAENGRKIRTWSWDWGNRYSPLMLILEILDNLQNKIWVSLLIEIKK